MNATRYTADVQVRFADIDAMHHVNNAVYATFLEEARSAYFRDVLDRSLVDADTVLASLSIDYRSPITHGQSVTVDVSASDLGTSSIPMEYEVRADGDLAAIAETVQVVFDRETGKSRPIPDEWRERIEGHRAGDD
ncbi:acyl-CoA thioesterase [Halegenticoccus tardaugens]|uniref:acyl-CoA thioesterase n=1 Tax=Halegenticoccus tardaugens TaxID=2071624 RepID=UPI00100BEAE6|nr:thioesterase family protein [Halegenticoccus tardaugens]